MGPLEGFRVLEIAGAGPTPFCGMMLADLGAEVTRIDRTTDRRVMDLDPSALMGRGKRSAAIELRRPEGVEVLLRLVEGADALIEGFRPGVAERLGFGPDVCLARNRRLVYGRGTGWGQDGPLADRAGHDIDYIAVAGALHPIGRAGERPVPPLNLVGDFGGGGMVLAIGVLAALHTAARRGEGQVVDAAMVDGAALLTIVQHELRAVGRWSDDRSDNLTDGGAPFYDTYETADGEWVAVGAMEPPFFAALLQLVGVEADPAEDQLDRRTWPGLRQRLSAAIKTKTRDEWVALAEGVDACLAPVLSLAEAPRHPYNTERGVFVDVGGIVQPGPAPRFSATPTGHPEPGAARGQHTDEVLREAGLTPAEIAGLRAAGALGD